MGDAANLVIFLLGRVSLNSVHAAAHMLAYPEPTDLIKIIFRKIF